VSYHPHGLDEELAALLAAGDLEGLLATFMHRVVGMSEDDLDRFRADPVWSLRVAAAPTIVRELAAEEDPTASLETLGAVRQPVLQLLGGASMPAFGEATVALDERLVDGRIVEIPGAKHAAHHTHPEAVVTAVQTFLTGSDLTMRD
jgi:pimeloyl-ACP methyl ester carboxylesterase